MFVLVTGVALPSALSQAKSKPMAFEVVSIRQNKSGVQPGPPNFGPTGDGFRAINLPLIGLFQFAYAPTDSSKAAFFPGNRIVGAPDWVNGAERYDVQAKVSEADLAAWQNPTLQPAMQRAMLQTMLEERYKAVVHRENKEVSIFALTVAKGGPKFKEAESMDMDAVRAKHPGGVALPTGLGVLEQSSGPTLHFYDASIVVLLQVLGNETGRPIEDRTGLKGRYDFTLQIPLPSGPDDSVESIFTAVQEQLGLKLDSAKGSVETLVIDHVERPSEN